jgi:DNA primase
VAGRIRDEDIAVVRERSPVADIVGEYVALRPAGGGNLKGLCPFHEEKSPSFNVTPARGFFYCFGCAAGGDVISFVQQIDHLSFAEAVERLAARAGIQLRYEQGGAAPIRQQGQRARLAEANRVAATFYADQLGRAEAAPAREFLARRGFDAAVAEPYGCGYAPSTWDAVTSLLLGRGYTPAELVTAGLSRQSSRGSLIDRFHRRLLWPIRDIAGDVVGFGARRLFDDDPIEAKYLNTPETPLYRKSQVLYGVDLAKREIARRRQAVVVEGYTDVMACHQAGVPTAVATCGTAFGAEHVSVLRRLLMDNDSLSGEVIFTFDGDEAGMRAAERAFSDDQRFMTRTFVAIEHSGLDPCELRQSKGDAAVRDLVARRQPLVEFVLRSIVRRHNLDTAEGQVRALEQTIPLVARIRDEALRDEYARRLSGYVGVDDPNRIVERVRRTAGGEARRGRRDGHGNGRAAARPAPDDPALGVEREVLKLAVQSPQLAGPLFDAVDETVYTDPTYAAIRHAIAEAGGAASGRAGPAWVDRIGEHCPDPLVRSVLSELAVERMHTRGEPDGRYVAVHLARLQEPAAARRIAVLQSKLQRLNPLELPDEHARLSGELFGLQKFHVGLREQASGGL